MKTKKCKVTNIGDFEVNFLNLYQHNINMSCCSCSTKIRFIVVLVLVLEIKVIYLLVSDETCIRINYILQLEPQC